MQLLTLFARKEPTADTVSIQHGLPHKKELTQCLTLN